MLGEIVVELLLGQVGGIEARAGRAWAYCRRRACPRRLVPRPHEGVEPVEQRRIVLRRDLLAEPVVVGRDLAQIDRVHQVGGLDQQVDDLALLRGQIAGVDAPSRPRRACRCPSDAAASEAAALPVWFNRRRRRMLQGRGSGRSPWRRVGCVFHAGRLAAGREQRANRARRADELSRYLSAETNADRRSVGGRNRGD